MRVTVDQASFLAVLRRAAACTSSLSTQLDHRLLRVATTKDADGAAVLAVGSTDGLLAYRGFVTGPAAGLEVHTPGMLLLDAKDIVARIGQMHEGLITIGLAPAAAAGTPAGRYPSGNLRVAIKHAKERRTYGTAAVPEKGLAPIRWPDKSQEKSLATLSGETLARVLRRAVWAADTSDSAPADNALAVSVGRERVRITAGTNRSMALVDLPAGALCQTYVDDVVPWEGLLALKCARALVAFADSAGPLTVTLTASPGQIVADAGRARIGCALLAVPGRNVAAVFEILTRPGNTQEIVVGKKAFLDALSAMRTAINPTSDNPGVYLAAHGAALHLAAEGAGEAQDEIPTATPITRSMIGQYLPGELDEAAKAAAGDDLSLTFCDAMGTPVLLTDVEGGISLSAVVIGMVKYRSRVLDALIAGKGTAP